MPQRVILIHSPHSGRSSKLPVAIKHLEQAGLEVVNSISIADLDDLPAQGTSWKESGVAVAIAAGGDGLVGGVITHIAESGLPLQLAPRWRRSRQYQADVSGLRPCMLSFSLSSTPCNESDKGRRSA